MRKLGTVVLAVVLMLTLSAGAFTAPVRAQDGVAIYSARGPYTVGVRDYVIEDADRPLDISVWYPAINPDGVPEETVYDAIYLDVPGRAIRDAAPAAESGPYPLVIFSHGAGGFRQQSVYFTEHLASYGLVVIASEHPRSNLVTLQAAEDQSQAAGDASGIQVSVITGIAHDYGQRPLDMLRQIDFAETLTTGDGDFAGIIDTGTIAVSGHSFGGYTAMAAGGARLDFDSHAQWCRDPYGFAFDPAADPVLTQQPVSRDLAQLDCFWNSLRDGIAQARGLDESPAGLWPATTDPRIRAIVALAPWNAPIFGPQGLGAVTIPTMIQVGTADETTPPVIDAYAHFQYINSPDKALVVFKEAEHLLFVNTGMEDIDDAAWDMDTAHELVNHFATAFLLAHLRDDPLASAALAPEAVDFAGIQYARAN